MNQVLRKQPNENFFFTNYEEKVNENFFFTNYEEKVNENYILNGI